MKFKSKSIFTQRHFVSYLLVERRVLKIFDLFKITLVNEIILFMNNCSQICTTSCSENAINYIFSQ